MKPPVKTISIKGITIRYLAIILLVALAGVLMVAAIGSYSSREAVNRHEVFELNVLSRDIGDLVGFYRHIAEAVARRQDVADILQFADIERAVIWAKEVRSIVPQSIGVALVEPNGSVLGEPLRLKLGKRCVADLAHMLKGKLLSYPPVHSGVPSMAHFDIIVPVKSEAESLGLLFMSFSLDVLKRRITERISDRQHLSIREKSGELIAEGGATPIRMGDMGKELSIQIPGTDWLMYYQTQEHEIDHLLYMATGVGGVIFAITMILMLFFSTRIVGFFTGDLNLIRNQLDRVHSGGEIESQASVTRLLETKSIMADVSELVQQIEQANSRLKHQSMHDVLTGLYNRRAFDEAVSHYCNLATRGNMSRLILLDLDLFKQVNDRYGHGVGDEVLGALAESLRERCRNSDILARLGGDEFALILPDTPGDGNELDRWFKDLEQRFIQKQMQINGGKGIDPQCRISAGSVVINENSGKDIKSLMAMADQHLYEAKRAGRAKIRY